LLIVEDDKSFLNICKTFLERLGYTVLNTQMPKQAIHLAEKHIGNIHMVITDVVMPEMNGVELLERLITIMPGMKCLYMSGYTSNIIFHNGLLYEGVNFIQKPFSMKMLAEKIREILDTK